MTWWEHGNLGERAQPVPVGKMGLKYACLGRAQSKGKRELRVTGLGLDPGLRSLYLKHLHIKSRHPPHLQSRQG